MIKKVYIFVPIISILSLVISFKFGIDTSGGTRIDFHNTWRFIYDLNSDLSILYIKKIDFVHYPLHYPLHYLIVSRFDFFVENKEFFLNTFFLISLFLPVVFYKCLVLKFGNVEKKKLILLASLIYLLPSYRSAAMWGNVHITALFFLLFSFFFYLKWNKNNENSFNLNILLQITFLALASYTRQYYVILFPFFFLKYLKYLSIKNFIYLSFFAFILSLPGIIYLQRNPELLVFNVVFETTNFLSSILVASSIMSFYLIPFFLKSLVTDIEFAKKIYFSKKNIAYLILSFIFILFLSPNFLYLGNIGGGIFLKLSRYLLSNEIIFFLSSLIGFFLLLPMINNKIENFFLILVLLISFSSGLYIFHKYFEPMFLIILFCLFDKEITKIFLKDNMLFIYIYFVIYLLAAIMQLKYNLITI